MRTRSMLLLSGLVAALALALATAAASASRLSVDEQQFRMVWQPMTFYLGEFPARCNITLEGSFGSRTFTKTSGVKARSALTVNVSPCTGGAFTLLTEALPWEFSYESFTGTLPRIQEVNFALRAVAFKIELGSGACLILVLREPAKASFRLDESGAVREIVVPRSAIVPQNEACALLYGHGYIAGTATITKPGSAELIHMTLI